MWFLSSAFAQDGAATAPSLEQLAIQLAPMILLSLIFAIPVFRTSKKLGWNPWVWTVLLLIPLVGYVTLIVFFWSALMSIVDRLNALRAKDVAT